MSVHMNRVLLVYWEVLEMELYMVQRYHIYVIHHLSYCMFIDTISTCACYDFSFSGWKVGHIFCISYIYFFIMLWCVLWCVLWCALWSVLWCLCSLIDKFKGIGKLTVEHSRNLGTYVALYKTILCLMRNLRRKNDPFNAMIAGALAGTYVFGGKTAVNHQINLVCFYFIWCIWCVYDVYDVF